ncbi:MAG: hypothetical protein KF834_02145 [Burkholderiales bacterium]|nr:hypothetical protein [Burkholderiales bacterium]
MFEFYMSAVGFFLTAVAAVIAAGLSWWLTKEKVSRSGCRWLIVLLAVFLTIAGMTWDVVRTSVTMAQLCPQAGVFVKESIRVEGFYINSGYPDMLKEGFQYIESQESDDRLIVYRKIEGEVIKEKYDAKTYAVKSRYEIKYDVGEKALQSRRDIGIQRSFVRDRLKNEELAYALRYYAYPGWVDRHSLSLLTQVLWACPNLPHAHAIEMRKRALLPLKNEG